MTDKKTEALKLALEAICGSGDFLFNWHECEPNNEREVQSYQATLAANEKAFKAIRSALTSEANERCVCGEPDTPGTHRTDGPCLAEQPAQQWTDETAKVPDHVWVTPKLRPLAKIAREQQEPVAWKDRTYGNLHHQDFGNSIPLYTSPPASKPWVGLTDEEIERVCIPLGAAMLSFTEVAQAIEAKLKEKNHG